MTFVTTALMGFFLLSGALAANPASVPAEASYTVKLTGYNAVPGQTDGDPMITADGGPSNPQVVAARSRDLADELPFGTVIEIDGPDNGNGCGYNTVSDLIGYRVIADTMAPQKHAQVDVLFSTHDTYVRGDGRKVNAANVLGFCAGATIKVVGHIDPAKLPKTQSELAALVDGGLALNK